MLLLGKDQQTKPYRSQMDGGDIAGIVARLLLEKSQVLLGLFEIQVCSTPTTTNQSLLHHLVITCYAD